MQKLFTADSFARSLHMICCFLCSSAARAASAFAIYDTHKSMSTRMQNARTSKHGLRISLSAR